MHKLKKAALYTDHHFGAKNGSEQHNLDCIEYLNWFCGQVRKDKTIDHIIFLGDYFEHRHSISGLTLHYGYHGMKIINDLGLPYYHINGNHDQFYKSNRDIFNTISFEALSNITMINDITVIPELGEHGAVLSPYLFFDEYPRLLEYTQYPYLFIHAEFKGFVVTGDTVTCEHGSDHTSLKQFKRICSGHFHQFQEKDNVTYIGNTFPTNYADANDTKRGMATLEYATNKFEHISWPDCPSYTYCKLSQLIASPSKYLVPKGNVKAFVDIDIEQNESILLKEKLVKKYNVRELVFVENNIQSLDGDTTLDDELKMESIDTVIKHKLKTVQVDNIDTDYLVKIYEGL